MLIAPFSLPYGYFPYLSYTPVRPPLNLKPSLTRRHRNDRLPGRPRAAAPEPRVEEGPRLEQVLAAGVAQRLQVRHEAEVGQREVRAGQVALARGGEVRVEHVERGRRA